MRLPWPIVQLPALRDLPKNPQKDVLRLGFSSILGSWDSHRSHSNNWLSTPSHIPFSTKFTQATTNYRVCSCFCHTPLDTQGSLLPTITNIIIVSWTNIVFSLSLPGKLRKRKRKKKKLSKNSLVGVSFRFCSKFEVCCYLTWIRIKLFTLALLRPPN